MEAHFGSPGLPSRGRFLQFVEQLQLKLEDLSGKKMVTPAAKREAVAHLRSM
jgi:hypothetical protein